MFSFFKKKPVITEQPVPPEVCYPKNVKLVKDKIDRLKGTVSRDCSYGTRYSLGEISFSSHNYNIYGTYLHIALSNSDKKEIFDYLAERRQKEIQKQKKKEERDTLKYLKS